MAPLRRLLVLVGLVCVAPLHAAPDVPLPNELQVTIETRFLEVSDNFLRDVGIDFGNGPGPSLQESAQAQALGAILLEAVSTKTVTDAIEQDETSQVLSSATLTTVSGATASATFGGPVTYDPPGGGTQTNYDSLGVRLDVRPTVASDGLIRLSLEPTISELEPPPEADGRQAPRLATRRASSTVSVRDGATVALGGILSASSLNTARRYPFLTGVPYIGELFESQAYLSGNTELVVIVSPRLLGGATSSGPAQVAVDTWLVEASQALLDALGIAWTQTAAATAEKGELDSRVVSDPQLSAILQTLEGDAQSRVLSAPNASVAHGETAVIRAGGAVEYVASDGGAALHFDDVGVQLNLTPFITPAGDVVLDLQPVVRSFAEPAATGIPEIATRTAQTTVKMRDGQTLAIAGLITQDDIERANRSPALAAIPVLGELFSSTSFQDNETSLLVLVTPRLSGASSTSAGTAEHSPESGTQPARGTDTADAGGCLSGGELDTVALGPKPSALESAAKGIAGGLLGSLSGGVLGSSGGSGKTRLARNPLKKTEGATFTLPDGLELNLRVTPNRSSDGMIFGVRADKDTVRDRKLIFADMMLVDGNCEQLQPTGRYIYEVTRERKLHITVEFWRWQDGALVEHWSKAGTRAWSDMLGSGELPTWVGVEYSGVTPQMVAQGGWSLVAAFSYEDEGNMVLQPYGFDLLSSQQAATQQASVPGLGEVPLIGELFRSDDGRDEQDELLVFVTPRVVRQ